MRSIEELEPNWNEAPKWAKWWTLNYVGMAWWFEKKPRYWLNGEWYGPFRVTGWPEPHNLLEYRRYPDGLADELPLGIDWRTSLRKRPKT